MASISQQFQGNASPKKDGGYPLHLETPRMILREFDPKDDKQRLMEITNTPGFSHYCFDGSEESVDKFLKKCVDNQQPDPGLGARAYIMLAMVRKDTNELIGCVSLENKTFAPGYQYETNFFVDPTHRNSGFGLEAIINMSRYAIEDLNEPGLNVTIEADNAPSMAVAAHMGYKPVGSVQIMTPAFGMREYTVLIMEKPTFYEMRKHDKKPMLLSQMPKPALVPAPSAPKP